MELSEDLISVIVPVYNVEETLERCLDSILDQDGVTLEVILVDDGSTDSCNQICVQYAEKYDEVSMVRQENGGLSAARNTGLEIATGTYVVFIDSDDYILPGMFAELLHAAKHYDADICCCGFTKVRDGNLNEYSLTSELREVQPFEYLRDMLFMPLAGYVWNRFYKRSLIGFHRFVKSPTEDLLFNCELWGAINRVAYTPGSPYCYVFRSDSLSHSSYADIRDGVWAHDVIMRDVRKRFPDRRDVKDLLSARDAQSAFNELLLVSGIPEYDWIRPRLISMIHDNLPQYLAHERSAVKRIAYRVLPELPASWLGAIARLGGIQR